MAQLAEAEDKLQNAEIELSKVLALKADLNAKYNAQIAARDALVEKA